MTMTITARERAMLVGDRCHKSVVADNEVVGSRVTKNEKNRRQNAPGRLLASTRTVLRVHHLHRCA
jgi:hypothetical protein